MFWKTALTMKSYGSGYVMNPFSCVWPLNGVTTRQMFLPSIVVAVNGIGADNTPAPPGAMLPGRPPVDAPGESTLKQASLTLRPVSTPPPSEQVRAKPRGDRHVEEIVDALTASRSCRPA